MRGVSSVNDTFSFHCDYFVLGKRRQGKHDRHHPTPALNDRLALSLWADCVAADWNVSMVAVAAVCQKYFLRTHTQEPFIVGTNRC